MPPTCSRHNSFSVYCLLLNHGCRRRRENHIMHSKLLSRNLSPFVYCHIFPTAKSPCYIPKRIFLAIRGTVSNGQIRIPYVTHSSDSWMGQKDQPDQYPVFTTFSHRSKTGNSVRNPRGKRGSRKNSPEQRRERILGCFDHLAKKAGPLLTPYRAVIGTTQPPTRAYIQDPSVHMHLSDPFDDFRR
jgi:hypothetical protein